MKNFKCIFPVVAVIFSTWALPGQGQQVFSIYPYQEVITIPAQQSSANLLSIETPFRCQTDVLNEQDVITSIRIEKDDFKLVQVNQSDDLPRYEVNGFSFEKKPLDEALQQLVEEAGIEIYTEDDSYISLDAKDVYGELALVVDELTKAGETYYRYDAPNKRIYLTRRGRFELKVPVNRPLILGVLDALRGAGIENISTNWKTGVLTMTLTYEEEKRMHELVSQLEKNGQFLIADTNIYSITPTAPQANWGDVVRIFGADRIHTSNNGLMGKLLSMDHQKNVDNLMEVIRRYYRVTPISQGMAIVPNGWKMRFDIGKCAETSSFYINDKLSILIYPHLRKNGTVDAQITMDSANGELSTFKVNTAIDNELAIIGIPDRTYGGEMLAIMKLKLIRLVQGN